MKKIKKIIRVSYLLIKKIFLLMFGSKEANEFLKLALMLTRATPNKVDNMIVGGLMAIQGFIDTDQEYQNLIIDDDGERKKHKRESGEALAIGLTKNESLLKGFRVKYESKGKTFGVDHKLFSLSYDPADRSFVLGKNISL